MIFKYKIILCIFFLYAKQIFANKEIIGILEQATDLNAEEKNALWPLFTHFQKQYDYIVSQTTEADLAKEPPQFTALYVETQQEFENYFNYLLQEHTIASNNNNNNVTDKYNKTLPSIAELMGVTNIDLSAEDLDEHTDIESLLEDALNEAQIQIDEIIQRSLQLETQLLKINKPKLVEYIFKALSVVYKKAAGVSRAAYCTYSHIPQLNESLHHIYDGADCYNYTKHLVLRIEQETMKTVKTIRKNVLSLAGIYKKIAGKKSLLGKLSAVILNLSKILHNIQEASQTGSSAMDTVENELPTAVEKSVSCGRYFAAGVPRIIETVSNLTTCITFVDDTNIDYDFMKVENERDFMLT